MRYLPDIYVRKVTKNHPYISRYKAHNRINYFFTEADKNGDKGTYERCLQRHLVLVTDVKLGNKVWKLMPQGLWKEGESLRQVIYSMETSTS